jgi:hypothetical protein
MAMKVTVCHNGDDVFIRRIHSRVLGLCPAAAAQ